MIGSESLLSAFDVDRVSAEALLFQTGYLTIVGEESRRYRLGYPNLKVRRSLGEALLEELLLDEAREETENLRLGELLEANDFKRLETLFRGIFAPHQWYMNSPVYEAHYASVQLLGGPRAGGRGQRQPGARRRSYTANRPSPRDRTLTPKRPTSGVSARSAQPQRRCVNAALASPRRVRLVPQGALPMAKPLSVGRKCAPVSGPRTKFSSSPG